MFYIDFNSLSATDISSLARHKLLEVKEDWEKNIWQFLSDWFNPSVPFTKVFSSGSTGAPKQIEHSREVMLASARMTCEALQLHNGCTALLCLPANKISGMMMIVRSLYLKMNLYCVKPSSTPLSALGDELEFDFASFTPMQFGEVMRSDKAFSKADKMKRIILGGEDVRPEILQKIKQLKSEVYVTFGMTETVSHIALKKLNGPQPDSFYKTLPGIKVESGENNNLVIKAPQLAKAHLITNDAVRIISDTEFEWLGRTDNIVNSGGVKIQPELLEQKLTLSINKPFFIGGVPDKETGERLVLMMETGSPLPVTELKIIKEAFLQLEKLHRPKEIRLVPVFIRTATGKVIRKENLSATNYTTAE